MKLFWTHIWRSRRYQRATRAERRMIELRYALAHALRKHRRSARVTQQKLAHMIGSEQATISRLERASLRVTLDYAIYAFIALDLSDADIAAAINASLRGDVQTLRKRMNRRLAQRPAPGFRNRS
jgi:transcriptional regulator with XRE-family HTH domain